MRWAGLALAVLLVAGCSESVSAMRLTRFSTIPENHYPALDRSVADAGVARRV
jgi:hypothetical protein